MNYWLTTHWPPRFDADPNDIANGIWLPDGREAAGVDLIKDDKVLIYQARSGRKEIRKKLDGTEYIVPTIEGKEGIIAACEAQCEIFEYEGSEPTKYVGGSEIWWRWHAPLTLLSKSGFVPRDRMNGILGYKPDYNLHGFGDLHSGLKKINEYQFNDLLEIFKGNVETAPYKSKIKFNENGKCAGGGGEESPEHFLLKIYVATNPSKVVNESNVQTFQIEYPYPTGDRADILLLDKFGKVLGVEVEVSVNDDQLEGALQAIKYRYMSEVMTTRKLGDSRAILVAYSISDKMKSLCKEYDIQCIEVDRNIVKQWSLSDEGKNALAVQSNRNDRK